MAISEPVVTLFNGDETITVTCQSSRVLVETDRDDTSTMDWERRADWMGEARPVIFNTYMVYQADSEEEAENIFSWVIDQICGEGWVLQ